MKHGGLFKTELAYTNWKSKYQYGDETPLQTFVRAAKTLASVEKKEDQNYWFEKFLTTLIKFQPIDTHEFNSIVKENIFSQEDLEIIKEFGLPVGLKTTLGGRITANIGTEFGGTTLLNCFIGFPVQDARVSYFRPIPSTNESIVIDYKTEDNPDNLANIYLTLLEQAQTLKSEGGWGINFSWIRPRSTVINGIGIEHPGVVKYLELFDKSAEVIVQGNSDGYTDTLKNYLNTDSETAYKLTNKLKKMARKGAQMAVLDASHPDIEEFVRAKQQAGRLTKFNISVLIDDELMLAVENDDFYDLHFNGKIYKTVKARELYDLIMQSTYNRAEPGVLFYSSAQANNPISYLGNVNASNPCGEIFGNPHTSTVCLLGNVNLTQYVNNDRTFDWDLYENDIAMFSRMLDNVNDLTYAPLDQYVWATKNIRQYGMGLSGLASAMYMLGIKFNSEEGTAFAEKAAKIREDLTWKTSALLASEKGTFPMYNKENFESTNWFTNFTQISEETKDLIRKYGVRNAKTSTAPPNGNCVSINTEIVTSEGLKSMQEIFSSHNIDTNKIGWNFNFTQLHILTLEGYKPITGFYVNGETEINKITTISGELNVTNNHRLLVKVDENKAVWKYAKDLKVGDKILKLD